MTTRDRTSDESLARLFGEGARVYPRGWPSWLLAWLLFIAPLDVVMLLLWSATGGEAPGALAASGRILLGLALLAAQWLEGLLISLHGVFIQAVAGAAADESGSPLSEGLSRFIARLPAIAWTFLLVVVPVGFVAALGGLAAAVLAADNRAAAVLVVAVVGLVLLYFGSRWSLATMVVLFEGLSGVPALRRSSELVRRRFGLYFAHWGVVMALTVAPVMLLGFVGESATAAGRLPAPLARSLMTVFSALTVGPFGAAMFLALYRREAALAAAPARADASV